MLTSSFGRELAQEHLKDAIRQAERGRLIGYLKRQRREAAAAARRKPSAPCPKDPG